MPDEIIQIMINQHRGLQSILGVIAEEIILDQADLAKVDISLRQFADDLTVHLKLENEQFYGELLQRMKAKGEDTEKTELFIAQMKDIEVVVLKFLEKFHNEEQIRSNFNKFNEEFPGIVDTLNMRIESEEAGVYVYWEIFK